jgi:hypothetical protein
MRYLRHTQHSNAQYSPNPAHVTAGICSREIFFLDAPLAQREQDYMTAAIRPPNAALSRRKATSGVARRRRALACSGQSRRAGRTRYQSDIARKRVTMKRAIFSFLLGLGIIATLPQTAQAADSTKCLDGKVSVQVPAGLDEQSNSADACRFGRFSSADYAVFHYNIHLQANEAASPQAMVASKIAAIQSDSANKGITVLSQGAHPGNPLTDYIAVVKYHRDVKVGHDLRTYYYKTILFSFGGNGSTRYFAQTSVQNENGSKIDALFSGEQTKFYAFLDSIRFVISLPSKKLKVVGQPPIVRPK